MSLRHGQWIKYSFDMAMTFLSNSIAVSSVAHTHEDQRAALIDNIPVFIEMNNGVACLIKVEPGLWAMSSFSIITFRRRKKEQQQYLSDVCS